MTAAVRPQAITDQATEAVARHRAAAEVLAVGYRSALATSDPLAAFAGVAGAAWQSMCSRELSQVLAAAVQVIVEMQDAAGTKPRRWLDRDGQHWQQRGDGLIALETENGLSGLFVCTDEDNLADEYGPVTEVTLQADVDRHWGPLAATGGEL